MFNEMMRAEIWLEETLASGESLEELAARLGYSSSQVRRRFRQCFGLSPSAYRESLRLEKAARLLTFTPRGVREIAGRCGYTNHSAFSRAFQRRYHQSPREFRLNRHRALKAARPTALAVPPTLHTLPPAHCRGHPLLCRHRTADAARDMATDAVGGRAAVRHSDGRAGPCPAA